MRCTGRGSSASCRSASIVFKHNLFGEAMRKVDPSITLLATGATPDEMTIYGIALPRRGQAHTRLRLSWRLGLRTVHSLLRIHRHHVRAFLFLCRAEIRSCFRRQAGRLQPRQLHGQGGRAAGRMGPPPGEPGAQQSRGLRRVSSAHSGPQDPANSDDDRRMGLYRRREQSERKPGERDGAPGNVPALRPHQNGRPHHGDGLDRLQRYGIGAQHDRASFQALPRPLRLRAGRGRRQLASASAALSGGSRSAESERRQSDLSGGCNRRIDERRKVPDRRHHQRHRIRPGTRTSASGGSRSAEKAGCGA